MMTVRCYLAPSQIEGLGVFATEPIRKGEIVWKFDPEFDQVFSADYIGRQPDHIKEFLERYTYAHPSDPRMMVLDSDEGRFMNHSDLPNTDFSDPELGVALCDIETGVELTCDYRHFTIGPVVHQPSRHQVAPIIIEEKRGRRLFARGH
ncbi:SET domain-containing protein-lysine N-methyltransferase [Hyphomonas sp. FCG-A18]|uniref:SET domain-containing protein n=1 Tax=Hyphomonas sp. FCG-A18 TaxID=3080019 RepID=UPI002B2AEE87|nr:SET domain-containing protein-lysine N-methyltransferase [Hyphomonas sp. FCG-A18]